MGCSDWLTSPVIEQLQLLVVVRESESCLLQRLLVVLAFLACELFDKHSFQQRALLCNSPRCCLTLSATTCLV